MFFALPILIILVSSLERLEGLSLFPGSWTIARPSENADFHTIALVAAAIKTVSPPFCPFCLIVPLLTFPFCSPFFAHSSLVSTFLPSAICPPGITPCISPRLPRVPALFALQPFIIFSIQPFQARRPPLALSLFLGPIPFSNSRQILILFVDRPYSVLGFNIRSLLSFSFQ